MRPTLPRVNSKGIDRKPKVEPKILFVHLFNEVFDPQSPMGVRVFFKGNSLLSLKDETTIALGTTSPVKYLAFATGDPISDPSTIPNQSHIFAWTGSTKPRHVPPSGCQLLSFLKEQKLNNPESQLQKRPSQTSVNTSSQRIINSQQQQQQKL
eukprot:c20882_g1_i1.p1 GENE.c20882_g1_i1~~c20882_g1_i1.p1  ORF type:complete len:153 (-),score=47.50 c20882_g1_i1:92-550(-)